MKRLLAALLFLANPAGAADEAEALGCVKTKVWEGYAEGWSVRTVHAVELALDAHRASMVALYAGRSYRFLACGTEEAGDLDIVLYDVDGNVVARDATADRQPSLEVTDLSGTYYLVVHLRSVEKPGPASVAVAVTHR